MVGSAFINAHVPSICGVQTQQHCKPVINCIFGKLQHRNMVLSPSHVGTQRPIKQRGCLLVTAAVKQSTGKNVACSKTLIAKEGQEEAVLQMCTKIVEYSREKAKDKANGIMAFECSRVRTLLERNTVDQRMGHHSATLHFVYP